MRRVVLLAVWASCAGGADWPRFGGPSGDFQLSGELKWPAAGPKRLWQRELGDGFSSIVTDGRWLYTMERRGGQEVVVSLDAETGATLWAYAYDAPLPANFDLNNTTGPRATPTIADELVFTAGAAGRIHALERKTGRVVWSRDVAADLKGEIRNNGYTASPMVWKDTVIVFPWAKDGAVMALRRSDGSIVRKKHSFVMSYSSPMLIELGGRTQMVMQFAEDVVGLDPGNGEMLWSHPHTNTEKVSVAMPVWSDGLLLLSSAYDGGSRVLRLSMESGKTKVEQLWSHRMLRVHHSDMVRIGGTVFAASGDMGACPLAALDLLTGKLLWRDRTFPKASLVAVGKQLLILDEDGMLALATPGENGLEVLGKVQAMAATSWTPPTLVGRRLYLRDHKTVAAYSFE